VSTERRTTTIRTDALARVEGEGAMHVRIRDGAVEDVKLEIYEPPRMFEAMLRGRAYADAPDFTSRICGICPIAYQMSACAAIEDAFGVEVDARVWALRRLIYCGEWLESHGLHVFMLHAPDFLGYEGAIEMARDGHAELVESGLAIKKSGNQLMSVVGGRAVHPVNVRVGGFYRAPTAAELAPVRELLERSREALVDATRWAANLDFPDADREFELVALRADDGYPIERGRLVTSSGLDIGPAEFTEHFVEEHVEHSTALHSRLRDGTAYLTGPLARFGLNRDRLTPTARELADEAGLGDVCRNPFRSIVVRCVEMLYAADEALRIIRSYEPPDPPAAEVEPRPAIGTGWTEAPRGVLWHRYELAADGTIQSARIVPPTSQNQATIEDDLRELVAESMTLEDRELGLRCEQAIRNYDPCISCSTHFLRIDVDRA
jgi:coenzyme F420-reducing hydrogenase alpha subunit